jgi:tRNA 2-thiouridine synthesizing protein E
MTTEETLARIAADVAYLAERQRRMEELVTELTPVAKLMMGAATEELVSLESRGWLRFLKGAGRVADKVAGAYGEAELEELGQDVLAVLDTARALSRPEVLAVASDAARVVQQRDTLEPVGVLDMMRATGDFEVQRGLAVLFELLRHLGRAADAMAANDAGATRVNPPARPSRPTALAATAPTSGKRPSKMDEIRAKRAGNALGSVAVPGADKAKAPSCTPTTPGPAAAVLDGVSYTADGFLADPKQWTRELAVTLAHASEVELTDAHWVLVEFARKDWETTGVSPNIRRLTTGTGVNTRDVYALFKKAPGKTIARVAGIPKPAGCI